ncbi:MAG: MMPL family transporter [Candidatus Omnitrophota bacterium]
MLKNIVKFSCHRPRMIVSLFSVLVLLMLTQLFRIKVDTDPENMLSKQEFVRVFHEDTKKEFSLYDYIVFGIVNEKDALGVFNVGTLTRVYQITKKIEKIPGVVSAEIIAPSTKDAISSAGEGVVEFNWLMPQPPVTQDDALRIRKNVRDNPLLNNTLISEDGKALCLFIPIEKKDMSYRISQEIFNMIKSDTNGEKYYITGLPVAEDTFGVEMFKQMGLSAPLAGLIIFFLMWMFFKNIRLIVSPMLIAVATVIFSMGLLIMMGFRVHIMSSMIPIFLMPIAVLDSVHVLNEFFEHYQRFKDKREAIVRVMENLFTPMLYTSLTTIVGFLSLLTAPVPPVQVFGVFVAIGVAFAWIATVTFIPAYVMLMKEKTFENFGLAGNEENVFHQRSFLQAARRFSVLRPKIVLIIAAVVMGVSIFGIFKIKVNDNPVKWFAPKHRIRVADTVLNRHFGGTYTAYLVMDAGSPDAFKNPEMLRFLEKLQLSLKKADSQVGKSTSVADLVKKVYYELMGEDRSYNMIPSSSAAVAQCLFTFQNSHKPQDLWHLVTPDYAKVNVWVQLKSGDNRDMERVVRDVEEFISRNPPPLPVKVHWAGLTYINTVWQNRMVHGMLKSLMGSFIIVFLMMAFLFRSFLWGFLSMVPLSVTIAFIYGFIGLIGRDYDMPIAVLSSLTLGLSIDFSIHFLERMRSIYKKEKLLGTTLEKVFEEPARAIVKNAIVVSVAFLPLLLSSLVPYKTVGFFMAAIMAVSSVATLIILPALTMIFKKRLFRGISPGT